MSRIFIALIALSLSNPANALGRSDRAADSKPKTIVIAHERCALSDTDDVAGSNFLGSLLALVAPTLIKLSIDATVEELEKVRTVKAKGSTEGYLFSVPNGQRSLSSNLPGCITMVTGEFKGDYANKQVKDGAVNGSVLSPQATAGEILNRLDNHITLDARDKTARLYSALELRVIVSDDNTAFRYRPAYMRVLDLMPGNRRDKQGLVYNISIAGPGASPDGTVYSLAPISFGSVSAGFEVTGIRKLAGGASQRDPRLTPKLRSRQTGWLALPGLSDSSRAAYYRALASGNAGGSSYMPYSIKAEVVQTQKPSDAARLLAKILSGSKDSIATKVGELTTPSDGFAESQALLAAEAAVFDAQVALTNAQNADNPNQDAIRSAEIKLEIARNALSDLQQ